MPEPSLFPPGVPPFYVLAVTFLIFMGGLLAWSRPLLKRWILKAELLDEERKQLLSQQSRTCVLCPMRTMSVAQVEEFFRHNAKMYSMLIEGKETPALDSPMAKLLLMDSRVQTISEWIAKQQTEQDAQELAEQRLLTEAAKAIRDHSNKE